MEGMLFIYCCLNNEFTVLFLFEIVPVRISFGDCCALKSSTESWVSVIHA